MYELLASELHNKAHLVMASRLDAMSAYVMSRQGFDIQVPEQPKPMAFVASDTAVWSDNGYYIDNGVAIIDMIGTMVHRAVGMQAMSGVIGYTRISQRFRRALKDPEVKAILINGDTPGGAVSGAFDLSDLIFSARNIKPVYTLAADCLCSAGILIGSSAQKVYATQTGQVGSIGVVMKHMDISKWNAKTGINTTYIYAGDRKIDGNADEPLSKKVLGLFQDEIQKLYGMFAGVMERNTDLTEQEVIDTQAAVYLGEDAVDVGLAVEVTTAEKLLEDMKTEFGTASPYLVSTTQTGAKAMSDEVKPEKLAGKSGGDDKNADKVNRDENLKTDKEVAVISEKDKSSSSAKSETQAANDRFATIMQSDAAKGRGKAAVRLAKTDMSADDVIAVLSDLPAEASGPSKLDKAMEAGGGSGLSADSGAAELTDAQKILGDYRSVCGKTS